MPKTRFVSHIVGTLLAALVICMGSIAPAKAATGFPAGTFVIPMDGNQANRVQAFGLIVSTMNLRF